MHLHESARVGQLKMHTYGAHLVVFRPSTYTKPAANDAFFPLPPPTRLHPPGPVKK